MVGSKLMVLVYPLSMSFLPTQRGFCWMPNNPSCTECSAHPAESHCYPARRKSPLKVVAQCRTMSHDAQVNTCYNVNCQRRTREHTLPGANRAQKVVTGCRQKSRDAQGNMCYNVNCQRRAKAHTLPGATRTQKVVTECHQKSRDRRVNTCYNANW